MDPASVDVVAARARTENFPVASLLFPRAMRPHLRAIYGFARLVDMLGDEIQGDRLEALDELERELDACYEGTEVDVDSRHPGQRPRRTRGQSPHVLKPAPQAAPGPTWAVMRALQPTIRACDLPRELFQRLIEANRMDQRIAAYATWADLKDYCVHSADPVGRLVLGVLGRTEPELVKLSDDVCTGLQLVNFLQDVPRDLALGRVYLPAEDRACFGVAELAEPNPELTRLLRYEANRARILLDSGEELGRRLGGRVGRAVAVFARGGLAAIEALERADWDIFNGRPRPSRARLALAAISR